ncbi:hypothetical protein FRC07_001391 [Ceratobasidium sp. 392]|nr:hypothetical protein FRC07_001391 [Ceratobasidium sp. 392]
MTKEELVDAGEILGARFLRKVYGDAIADKLFLVIIGMSTFGGLIAVILLYARMIREAGRQGVLPYATFWSRVSRFKTPYGPILLKWGLSVSLLLITPAKDTFSFLVDLASYPGLVFALATACAVWILRRRRAEMGLPAHAYKAWNIVVIAYVVKSLTLLVLPWAMPRWFGYEIVEETVSLPGGAKASVLKRRYKNQPSPQEEPLLHEERLT